MKVGEFKLRLITEVKRLIKEDAIRISRDELVQKIKETKGKIFTVTFVKKDGTTRVMNARLRVRSYLKGGELPYDPVAKGLIPVFDIKKLEYRMVNTKTIISAKIGNNEYITI